MIIGLFRRYFKTYQGINYIPIAGEDRFCGLVGDNGVGKSSVIEHFRDQASIMIATETV